MRSGRVSVLACVGLLITGGVGLTSFAAEASNPSTPPPSLAGAAWTQRVDSDGSVSAAPDGDALSDSGVNTGQVTGDPLIRRLSPQGAVRWTTYVNADRILWRDPQSVSDVAGNTYVEGLSASADYVVQAVAPDGTVRWTISTGGYEPGGSGVVANDGSVYFTERSGSSARIEGYSLADGHVTLSYSDPQVRRIYAYRRGLIVTNSAPEVTYLTYSGTVTTTLDLRTLSGATGTFDSSQVDIDGALYLGVTNACDESVNTDTVFKVSPVGVSWSWHTPPGTYCDDYLTALPAGGVALTTSHQGVVGSVTTQALSATGTPLWSRQVANPPGTDANDVTDTPTRKPVVDVGGTLGIPLVWRYGCPDPGDGTCSGSRIDFVDARSGVQSYPSVNFDDVGSNQEVNHGLFLDNVAFAPGHLYVAGQSANGWHNASVSSFTIEGLQEDYTTSLAEQLARTSPPAAEGRRYVALGDSYSTGVGNPPFDALARTCDRSEGHSWPTELQRQADLELVANFACSDASTVALVRSFKGQPSQLESLKSVLDLSLVTATFGATDVRLSRALSDCFRSNCVKDGTLARAQRQLPTVYADLRMAYSRLHAATGARVAAIGYPNLMNVRAQQAHNRCPWLSPGEDRALNSLSQGLDRAMRRAATSANVEYVSQLSTLAGHQLCTRRPWVTGLRPTPSSPDRPGHPLAAGQERIAAVVKAKLGL